MQGKRRIKAPPRAIHLPNPAMASDQGLTQFFRGNLRWTRYQAREILGQFAMHDDEQLFARTILTNAPHLNLFRSNQKCFCGDFIVIDMTDGDPQKRSVYVVDLKKRAPLTIGGGGASNQFIRTRYALKAIARATTWITETCPFEKVVGDLDNVLPHLGVLRIPGCEPAPNLIDGQINEDDSS